MLDTDTERRTAYLTYARELLTHFVHGCETIYGDTFVVYNVHYICQMMSNFLRLP